MRKYCLPVVLVALILISACSTPQVVAPIEPSPQPPAAALTPTPTQPPAVLPVEPEAVETAAQPTPTPVEDTEEPVVSTAAAALPDPSGFAWQEYARGFDRPLFITGAGDGSGRLFVVSQTGQIWLVKPGESSAQRFLDISDRTSQVAGYSERGLLGLAFHPQFSQNGYFYVNYTDRAGDTHIARFSVSPEDPDRGDPDSEVTLLTIAQPYGNHNGGALVFGPDGYLYIALGDGGSAGDPQGNGQSLNTLLGKILRLDVDSGEPYLVPADNPFASGGGLPEIWAYGLRNPWRIAFDPLTGDLYIADVGQNQWEEINIQPAGSPGGENYGWDYREGLHEYEGTPPQGFAAVDPVAEYDHALGCSVTGGIVYRAAGFPEWQGVYLYGDYCSGRIWGLLRSPDGSWQNQELFQTGFTITSFGVDDAGEVYVTDYNGGAVYRLVRR